MANLWRRPPHSESDGITAQEMAAILTAEIVNTGKIDCPPVDAALTSLPPNDELENNHLILSASYQIRIFDFKHGSRLAHEFFNMTA